LFLLQLPAAGLLGCWTAGAQGDRLQKRDEQKAKGACLLQRQRKLPAPNKLAAASLLRLPSQRSSQPLKGLVVV
jgi:hypothetical protein